MNSKLRYHEVKSRVADAVREMGQGLALLEEKMTGQGPTEEVWEAARERFLRADEECKQAAFACSPRFGSYE